MIDSIALTDDATTTGWLPLEGVEPGRRGSASVTVVFNGHADARIAMYAQECAPSLPGLRISIFERTEALMPFPVFRGTLADFATRTSYAGGVGRWTGRGDGRDHAVTYEVVWTLPKDAETPHDQPKLALVWEARAV